MIENDVELRMKMRELKAAHPTANIRISETEYQNDEWWLRCDRRKIERVHPRAFQPADFFLYCRVIYHRSI